MQIAFADQWKITGVIDQSMEYDDNIGLRAENTPVIGYLLKPNFRADWRTTTMSTGLTGRGDIRRYDNQRWDCDSFGVGFDQSYLTRQHTFSLIGDYSRACSYSQQSTDTGIFIPNNQSETYSLNPTWNWQITQRDKLSLSPGYTQTTYTQTSYSDLIENPEERFVNFLRNNQSYSINLAEQHQWNRRLSSNVSLFFSNSNFSSSSSAFPESTFSQKVFGYQLGGEYALSRQWMLNAAGGGRWVQAPGAASTAVSFGETYQGGLSYKTRSDTLSFDFSRSVSPSSFGQIQDVTTLGITYRRELTRELSLNVNGSYSESQSVGESLTRLGQQRTYYQGSAQLIWKFARDWQFSAAYRYRAQEFGGNQLVSQQSHAYDSNAVMFHLKYNWDGVSVSR